MRWDLSSTLAWLLWLHREFLACRQPRLELSMMTPLTTQRSLASNNLDITGAVLKGQKSHCGERAKIVSLAELYNLLA